MTVRRLILMTIALVLSITLSACVTSRVPYIVDQQAVAQALNITNARFWADDRAAIKAALAPVKRSSNRGQVSVLALSSGGTNGAFGSGFLSGWNQTGTRPDFSIVTGVSIGALMAPFAFLGAEYDEALSEIFNSGEAQSVFGMVNPGLIFGQGVFSSAPLRRLVDKYVDDKMLSAVARAHKNGRRLIISTTELDSQRSSLWNMGAIAASTDPGAPDLFRAVLRASVSIPALLSPEIIEVEANERIHDEMHVDGGAAANLLLLINEVPSTNPQFYVILNGKLAPEFQRAKAGLFSVVERAMGILVKSNTKDQLVAARNAIRSRGGTLHVVELGTDKAGGPLYDFSPKFTRPLFEEGVIQGRKSRRWTNSGYAK